LSDIDWQEKSTMFNGMRGLVLIGSMVLLASCARENPLFGDGAAQGEGGSTMGSGGKMTATSLETADRGGTTVGIDSGGVGEGPPATTGVTTSADSSTGSTTGGDDVPRPDMGGVDTGPPPENVCCEPHNGAGCGMPAIEACVCVEHPECCAENWTLVCVAAVHNGCGPECSEPPPGDCCALGLEPGCGDWDIVECVCDVDPYCCNNSWDDECTCVAAGMCDACAKEPGGCAKPA